MIFPAWIAMKPRFEPHNETAGSAPPSTWIDPEAYDASEQSFAASLEAKPQGARFVLDEKADDSSTTTEFADSFLPQNEPEAQNQEIACDGAGRSSSGASTPPSSLLVTDRDSWRAELVAKMNQYRAQKRPRSPRYPSLQLKFETIDHGATARAIPVPPEAVSLHEKPAQVPKESAESPALCYEEPATGVGTSTAKILEFPVPVGPPSPAFDELAEPVFDRPRILEVPEVVPPPPALGGILIEPSEEPPRERREGFELPLIAAPFPRRILAGAIDAVIIVSAFTLFAYVFFRLTSLVPEIRLAAAAGAGLLAVFWAGYQYLMLVHSAATPGLRLAKLQLSRFDGREVPLTLRRWRVLASLLSGLSLGLGYAWCFLDEDQLCWHDRITHTYMAPVSK